MFLSSRQVSRLLNRDKSVVNRWARSHGVKQVDGFYLWDERKVEEYRRSRHGTK